MFNGSLDSVESALSGIKDRSDLTVETKAAVARLTAARDALRDKAWRVLVAGPMSVGKSSVVSTLWGDATLLPTAARDCTQTNSLIRVPRENESDKHLLLHDLSEEEAVDFALRGLSFYRVEEVLNEALGAFDTELLLKDKQGRERIEAAAGRMRKLFADDAKAEVLYDHLQEELECLEEFMAFLDSEDHRPGAAVEAPWDQRERYLMGLRGADQRKLSVGRLLALRRVELVRASAAWNGTPPHLIDSPMIPAIRNARRADLLLREIESADILVVVGRPEGWKPEPWLEACLKHQPGLAGRVFVVFNQIDTVDRSVLFSRSGLRGTYDEAQERMKELGMNPEHIILTCARLPFLALMEDAPKTSFAQEFRERLISVLERIASSARIESPCDLRDKLLRACDPNDAGIEALRKQLEKAGPPASERRNEKEADAALQHLKEICPDLAS